MKFRARIELNNINPYVHVSAARAARLKPGWRKPLPVRVRVNGQPEQAWHINMMPMGSRSGKSGGGKGGAGGFYLYLHGVVRKASNTAVGDRVSVEVEFDPEYKGGPAHAMLPAFRRALAASVAAKRHWDALIPSRKKEILRYFAGLKSEAARARNLERAMHVLSGKAGRFMGRAWNESDEVRSPSRLSR